MLPSVAKQLALNLLKGLSISHISLPIKIFEARSSIQRIVDFWSAAPKYLNAAADSTDPIERMENVITFSKDRPDQKSEKRFASGLEEEGQGQYRVTGRRENNKQINKLNQLFP